MGLRPWRPPRAGCEPYRGATRRPAMPSPPRIGSHALADLDPFQRGSKAARIVERDLLRQRQVLLVQLAARRNGRCQPLSPPVSRRAAPEFAVRRSSGRGTNGCGHQQTLSPAYPACAVAGVGRGIGAAAVGLRRWRLSRVIGTPRSLVSAAAPHHAIPSRGFVVPLAHTAPLNLNVRPNASLPRPLIEFGACARRTDRDRVILGGVIDATRRRARVTNAWRPCQFPGPAGGSSGMTSGADG